MKSLILSVAMVSVFSVAAPAFAASSSFYQNGKLSYGYTGSVNLVGQVVPVSGIPTIPEQIKGRPTGNTQVQDFADRVLPQDKQEVYDIAERAGIRF